MEAFPEKWKSYLAMIKKKEPALPDDHIKAALWATNGSAGMARKMLSLPWKCAQCNDDSEAVKPSPNGWYLVMNAWLCEICAEEGWVPGPLNTGWVPKDGGAVLSRSSSPPADAVINSAEAELFRSPDGVHDVIRDAENELAAITTSQVETRRNTGRLEGKKIEGNKVVPEVASVTVGKTTEGGSFEVKVAKLSGESIHLICEPTDTVASLKWKIELEWKIRKLRQVLTLDDDVLPDDDLLTQYAEQVSRSTIMLVIAPEKKTPVARDWPVIDTGSIEVTVSGYGKHKPMWLVWEEGKKTGSWKPLSSKNAGICRYHRNPEAIHTGLDADDKKRYKEKNHICFLEDECDYPEQLTLNIGDVLFLAFGSCWKGRELESSIEDDEILNSIDDDDMIPWAYVNGKRRHQFPDDYVGFSWVGTRPNDWLVEGSGVCFKAIGRGSSTLSWEVKEEPDEDEHDGDEPDEEEED